MFGLSDEPGQKKGGVRLSGYLAIFLAFIMGALATLQSAINTGLGKHIGGVTSALASFTVGTATLVVFYLISGEGGFKNAAKAPAYLWIGGLLGAVFVYGFIKLIPLAGTATVVAGAIAGQLLLAMLIDQFGWLGMPRIGLDWTRGLGAVLLLVGVKLISK